jgi:ankyrin repeat protein
VKLLLDSGAKALAKDDRGVSCITIARTRGHPDIVKLREQSGVTE